MSELLRLLVVVEGGGGMVRWMMLESCIDLGCQVVCASKLGNKSSDMADEIMHIESESVFCFGGDRRPAGLKKIVRIGGRLRMSSHGPRDTIHSRVVPFHLPLL